MTREELKKSVKVLKKSAKDTVGNREKNNKFTVIADIKPDSFDWIMSQVLEALSEPTKTDNIVEYEKAIKDIKAQINSNNRGSCDYFIVDEIEKIVNKIPTKTEPTTTGKITCNSCSYEIELSEPTRPKAKWISVDERLPENFQRVLVTIVNYNGNKVVRVAEYYGRQRIFQIKENNDQWEVGDKGLLAWRPLPEPYKAESEDKE